MLSQRKELSLLLSLWSTEISLNTKDACPASVADMFENFPHFLLCHWFQSGASKLQPADIPPLFINKVLLEQRQTHFSKNCLWLLSRMAECNSCFWMPPEPKILLSALTDKGSDFSSK
jgi:hypothetical protein